MFTRMRKNAEQLAQVTQEAKGLRATLAERDSHISSLQARVADLEADIDLRNKRKQLSEGLYANLSAYGKSMHRFQDSLSGLVTMLSNERESAISASDVSKKARDGS